MTSGADAWLVDERWFKAYPLVVDTSFVTLNGSFSNVVISGIF